MYFLAFVVTVTLVYVVVPIWSKGKVSSCAAVEIPGTTRKMKAAASAGIARA
jgi:hypothetical protein